MSFLDFLKGKKKEEDVQAKKELSIPEAPPTSEELPELPKERSKDKELFTKDNADLNVKKEEEKALKMQQKELDQRDELKLVKPIFVDVELYRDIVDELGLIKNTMKENEDTIARVAEFKQDEDQEFKKWQNQILDIQRKLIYADKTLFSLKVKGD